jgi:hypothetical protein
MNNQELNKDIDQIKEIPYKKKTLFFNKLSIVINIILCLGKAIMAIIYLDLLLGLSSLYSLFIVLCKLSFYAGEMNKEKEKNKYNYYLMMTIFLFIGSFIYFIYWIVAMSKSPSVIKYPTLQMIIYTIVFVIEVVFSLKGLFISNKEKDLLLNGIKFVNLSTALSSFAIIAMLIESLKGITDYYIIIFYGIVISFIMLGVYIYSIKHKKNILQN